MFYGGLVAIQFHPKNGLRQSKEKISGNLEFLADVADEMMQHFEERFTCQDGSQEE